MKRNTAKQNEQGGVSMPGTFGAVLLFALPTWLTSLFNTLYTIVDGIFVSCYAGTDALAAINTVYPLVNILTAAALLFATGGSAIAAIALESRDQDRANRAFSVSMTVPIVLGSCFSAAVLAFFPSILAFLGATDRTMADCRIYALCWLLGCPAAIGKELFSCFIRVDGSPAYSFATALSGGIANIVLDWLFIGVFGMGVLGAGLATVLGLVLSCVMGIIWLLLPGRKLHFHLSGFSLSFALRLAANGLSECVDHIAAAVTTIVFNRAALSLAGEDGIAAVSIIMYLQFLVIGVYFGYSQGISPLLGYGLGCGDHAYCRALERHSRTFLLVLPPLLYGLTFLSAPVLAGFFAAEGSHVLALSVHGLRLYGLGFLFCGWNIFSAIRLTACSQGHRAGLITFLRSFFLLPASSVPVGFFQGFLALTASGSVSPVRSSSRSLSFSSQGSYQGGDFHFPQGHPCRLMTIHRAHRYLPPCWQLCLSGVSAHRQKDAEVPPFWESLRIFSVSFGVAFCFLASAFSFAFSFCLTLAFYALRRFVQALCAASAMDLTYSFTGPAASLPYSARSLMMAEPTMAPSERAAIFFACSGVEMPKPTAQGMSVLAFTSFVIAPMSVVMLALVPVTPREETI